MTAGLWIYAHKRNAARDLEGRQDCQGMLETAHQARRPSTLEEVARPPLWGGEGGPGYPRRPCRPPQHPVPGVPQPPRVVGSPFASSIPRSLALVTMSSNSAWEMNCGV